MNTLRTVVLIILLLGLNLGTSHVLAATPSGSPTPTSSSSATPTPVSQDTIKQNIKDRIERVIENSSSAGTKVVRKKQAFVGKIAKVTAESVVITTLQGIETVRYNPQKTTVLSLPKLQTIKLEEVELNSFVIVMGYIQGEEAMEARRILVSAVPLFPLPREIILGTVSTIGTTSIDLRLRDDKFRSILLSKKTIYKNVEAKSLKRTDVEEGQEVMVIVPKSELEETATPTATLVRFLK